MCLIWVLRLLMEFFNEQMHDNIKNETSIMCVPTKHTQLKSAYYILNRNDNIYKNEANWSQLDCQLYYIA